MLSLRGVRKWRGGRAGRWALDGIDLEARAGEALVLLGANGAGKTTLLHVCAGVLTPDEGEVVLHSRSHGADLSPHRPAARRTIGFVPQAMAIYPRLTAFENLVFFGQVLGVPRAAMPARVEEGLALAGLSARAHELAISLSGGMQRRLSFACGVLHAPELLLLDEPTSGVDAESREQLYEAIELLKSRGTTIVCSTHMADEAARLADRVVVMARGRVTEARTRDELIAARSNNPEHAVHAAMNALLTRKGGD